MSNMCRRGVLLAKLPFARPDLRVCPVKHRWCVTPGSQEGEQHKGNSRLTEKQTMISFKDRYFGKKTE